MASHQIHALAYGASILGGIRNSRYSSGIETILLGPPGHQYNDFQTIGAQTPRIEFSTVRLSVALGIIGLTGLQINATPLDFYTVNHSAGAGYAATGQKVSVLKGFAYPTRITFPRNAPCTVDYMVIAGANSGSAPYSIATGQTVPTTATIDEAYVMGDVKLAASDIGPCLDVVLDMGFDERIVMGDRWPDLLGYRLIQPRVTIRTLNATALSTVGADGSGAQVSVVAEKCSEAAGRAGAGDLTFVTNQEFGFCEELSGAVEDDEGAITTLVFEATYNGTNAPVSYS